MGRIALRTPIPDKFPLVKALYFRDPTEFTLRLTRIQLDGLDFKAPWQGSSTLNAMYILEEQLAGRR